MMKGKGFELDEMELGNGKKVQFASAFMHQGARWSVQENGLMASQFFIGEGGKPEDNVKRFLHLCKVSNGIEIRYVLQDVFYDATDSARLYVSMSITRDEGISEFKRAAQQILDRSNVPDGQVKDVLGKILRDVVGSKLNRPEEPGK